MKPLLFLLLLVASPVWLGGCIKSHDIIFGRTEAISGVRGLQVEYVDGHKEFWPDLLACGQRYRHTFKSSEVKNLTFIDASQT